MHTLQMVNSFRLPWGTLMSYIPVIATIVTTFFSIVLARATLRQVEATDKGLALAREEFEREWNPDLHIKLERVSPAEPREMYRNASSSFVVLRSKPSAMLSEMDITLRSIWSRRLKLILNSGFSVRS